MGFTEPYVIMNFDNVYYKENFYKEEECIWIDCSDLQGTNCYCDDLAKQRIRELIHPYPLHGIHYIDSGNYHYVSELWLEKAKEPFVLVVFDHHTDMQPSLFAQLLSCGCWVKQVIDTNPWLEKVILIGAKESLVQQIPAEYRAKVICYSENTCIHNEPWQKYLDAYQDVPFYLSIDKDVLSSQEVITNWDQGSMTMKELESILRHIIEQHQILGIDICGEYAAEDNIALMFRAGKVNSMANEELLNIITDSMAVNMK